MNEPHGCGQTTLRLGGAAALRLVGKVGEPMKINTYSPMICLHGLAVAIPGFITKLCWANQSMSLIEKVLGMSSNISDYYVHSEVSNNSATKKAVSVFNSHPDGIVLLLIEEAK